MYQFHLRYPGLPHFSFNMLTENTHRDNNPAQYVDQDLVDKLESLRKKGVNLSILIFTNAVCMRRLPKLLLLCLCNGIPVFEL